MLLVDVKSLPITDDTTLDDEYTATHINAMPEALQALALAHHLDQFNAVPSYLEEQAHVQEPTA